MLKEKILRLKKEKNAVILAHCYQNIEIDEVADFVGDSFYLSKKAAETASDMIIFAGVYFMAQTAKIISPNKKVLLPNLNSGCMMADMINLAQLRDFKAKNPKIPTVCYINSTAEIKAECDICCTSSNAISVVKSLNDKEVLFLPDRYLGKWVQEQLGNINVITYSGYCPIHLEITKEDVLNAKKIYKNAKILAHPECHQEVTKLADYVGSTTGIMEYVSTNDASTFIIATETGVVERLKRDFPKKEIVLIKDTVVCDNMKKNSLKDIYNSLKYEQHEIKLDSKISKNALTCIKRMLEVV